MCGGVKCVHVCGGEVCTCVSTRILKCIVCGCESCGSLHVSECIVCRRV